MSLSTGPVLLRSEAILPVRDITQNKTKKKTQKKKKTQTALIRNFHFLLKSKH